MASCQRYDVTVIEHCSFSPAEVERFTALGMNCEPKKLTYCDVDEETLADCLAGKRGNNPVQVLEVRPTVHTQTADDVTGNGKWGCD